MSAHYTNFNFTLFSTSFVRDSSRIAVEIFKFAWKKEKYSDVLTIVLWTAVYLFLECFFISGVKFLRLLTVSCTHLTY